MEEPNEHGGYRKETLKEGGRSGGETSVHRGNSAKEKRGDG